MHRTLGRGADVENCSAEGVPAMLFSRDQQLILPVSTGVRRRDSSASSLNIVLANARRKVRERQWG
jgi:hypothetical protein